MKKSSKIKEMSNHRSKQMKNALMKWCSINRVLKIPNINLSLWFYRSNKIKISNKSLTAFYEKIIVMSEGHVTEFGNPFELLNQEESVFRKICLDSGDFEDLYRTAQIALEKQIAYGVVCN
jgi:hypothetical protein